MRIPAQKIVGGILFPAIVSPDPAIEVDFQRFVAAVREHRPRLESMLHSSGALLLRGFPTRTKNNVTRFQRHGNGVWLRRVSICWRRRPRTNVVGRVFTANESPPDQKIPFHHELAQHLGVARISIFARGCFQGTRTRTHDHKVLVYPSKLFFFCEVEPSSGGETPIVLSHHVYERMSEKQPEFVKKLEKHGLIYTRELGTGDDPSSPIGSGWQSTFLTKDKSIAEESKVGKRLRLGGKAGTDRRGQGQIGSSSKSGVLAIHRWQELTDSKREPGDQERLTRCNEHETRPQQSG
ncbi:Clavaminate synthase-like protein [Platanthera guangdongensis]|uniref:Clavaminate synthase-like protein n=1 Tax=Platanthera guangdongensis TaxID=2320717 RepID=A0ABR2N0E2_9ASPA